MTTAQKLEAELGPDEAINAFVGECVVAINQMAPELNYRHEDLDGFIVACWPCDGEPFGLAAQFATALSEQNG